MDPDRARQLLERERERIERAIADLDPGPAGDRDGPGEDGSEDLYQKEFDEGRAEELREQLAALERAEARLAAGTYGLSVESRFPRSVSNFYRPRSAPSRKSKPTAVGNRSRGACTCRARWTWRAWRASDLVASA